MIAYLRYSIANFLFPDFIFNHDMSLEIDRLLNENEKLKVENEALVKRGGGS